MIKFKYVFTKKIENRKIKYIKIREVENQIIIRIIEIIRKLIKIIT